jgi:hypothetical protein
MAVATKTIVVDNPKHPSPGAKIVIAREGLPVAPEYANHPDVVAMFAEATTDAGSDLADVDGGAYDDKEWTVDKLQEEVDKRGLTAASHRKADLIQALEDDDAGTADGA